jgi:ParB family transcriptional regulator, chromosome partitioning protein
LTSIDQERLAHEVVDRHLSVRQTEALVRQRLERATSGNGGAAPAGPAPARDRDTARLEQELSERIGAPVRIAHGATGRGQLVISYTNLDELQGILKHLR